MANDLFERGILAYQEQDYYEAHEQWEELWSDPGLPDRQFVQGFIQVAVSLFHARQGNLKGARSMIEKAMTKWNRVPAIWRNIDMDAFVRAARKWATHLHRISRIEEVDYTLSPEVKRI